MTSPAQALAAALFAGQAPTPERQAGTAFLHDLTAQARAGKLSPVVGRDAEILQVLEVASQRRKPNAVLIGPAGAGKTAVAEGLAQLCARHASRLPERLQGLRVLQLDVGSLVAGAGVYGEVEKRLAAVLQELEGENALLFIDELQTLVGAGGRAGHNDVAQWLKPHLARGALRVLAATTADEYSQIIARDSALERRFSPIYVQPLSDAAALRACEAHARWLRIDLPATQLRPVLRQTVHLARRLLCHRSMPDSAIDLLERSHAMAELAGCALSRRHVAQAAARLLHLPDDVQRRLERLRRGAAPRASASAGAASAHLPALATAAGHLLRTLGMATDSTRAQPACTPCLVEATGEAEGTRIASLLAAALGSEVIELDARASEREVFGAEPGYIGYGQRRPIHKLLDRPFAVVHLRGADSAPVDSRLMRDLRTGALRDAEGRQMAVHAAVVSGHGPAGRHPLGFAPRAA